MSPAVTTSPTIRDWPLSRLGVTDRGEALMGLVRAGFSFARKPIPQVFAHPPLVMAVAAFLLLASIMVGVPLRHAGSPEERR